MMKGDSNITSLNVRGLRDYKKRKHLFNMFHLGGSDIVFVQETHCCNIREEIGWEKSFGGKCFWSFGSNHSCGVGILINSKLNYLLQKFDFDCYGRYLVLDIDICNIEFRLINIYAPNDAVERKHFFLYLSDFFSYKT